MRENPEFLLVSEPQRFEGSELQHIYQERRNWSGVSYFFDDGRELLSFEGLRSKTIDYNIPPKDPRLLTELYFQITQAANKKNKVRVGDPQLQEMAVTKSTIPDLDNTLTRHHTARSTLFESKVKLEDTLARKSIESLVMLSKNYEYEDDIIGLEDTIKQAVTAKQLFRTQSLLVDFENYFHDLTYPEVWMIGHQENWNDITVGVLVGFMLQQHDEKAVIEPLIRNEKGIIGLFPKGSSLDPFLYVRDSL